MELELVDKSDYEKTGNEKTGKKEYFNGPDLRVAQRRCGHDRRAMVRFELNKSDRRSGKDRREQHEAWDKGHTLF